MAQQAIDSLLYLNVWLVSFPKATNVHEVAEKIQQTVVDRNRRAPLACSVLVNE